MRRRELLRLLRATGTAGVASQLFSTNSAAQTPPTYTIEGSGPTILAFDRSVGQYEGLTRAYRVVALDYPPAALRDSQSPTVIESFTADRVTGDILAVADRVGADRFAFYGFSWGGVAGLQLAVRTNRLSALICGGSPPLGAQYRDMVTLGERGVGQPIFRTYYRSIADWAERDAISKIGCPRLAFAGTKDVIVAEGITFPLGPRLAEHREELERMGWTVRLVDGFAHELGLRPDVVVPLIREFLDPILLNA